MAAQVNGSGTTGTGAEASVVDSKEKLQRWVKRLGTLPSLALPTDYPRPSESHSSILSETRHTAGKHSRWEAVIKMHDRNYCRLSQS